MATTPTNPVQPTPAVPLPAPPTLSDPDNFDERGDAFVLALSPMQQAINALADNAYTNALVIFGKAESAATSASTATQAAGQADTYRQQASSYASVAVGARDAAKGYAEAVSASLGIVDTRLLGGRALPPTTNNQGGAIAVGAMYYNTGSDPTLKDRWYIWSGTEWKLGPGDYTGAFVPLAGAKMLGPLKVRPNAVGEEAPQAQEVVSRKITYAGAGSNMNTLPLINGAWSGRDWVNAPSAESLWWYVEQIVHEENYVTQTSWGLTDATPKYFRIQVGGVWQLWRRMLDATDLREKVFASSTGTGPGDAKLYFLDPSKGSIHQLTVQYNTYFTGALRGDRKSVV